MEVEDAIVVGENCTINQREFVDTFEELDLEDLATYLSSGNYDEKYLAKASAIVENRYSYFGWKDYIFCYLNISSNGQSREDRRDKLVESITAYLEYVDGGATLVTYFELLYGYCLLSMPNNRLGGYLWKYFCKGIWVTIDHAQVCNMIHTRVTRDSLQTKLGLNTKTISSSLSSITRYMNHSNPIVNVLLYPRFKEEADPKEDTFAMPTCTYDTKYGIVRVSLPSDKCTMRGTVDPDPSEWSLHRKHMLKVLKKWMDSSDVVDSYLDILAGALSEFKPRYAVVNSGTGSDGKSTFFHILERIFGSYCMIAPTKGPSTDSKNSNDATPLASRMVGKRLCLTGDAEDITRLISSSGFKSVSGGDSAYIRGLHQEASEHTPRLKMLLIVNTNQTSIVLTTVSTLTRIKLVKWLHKTVTDEDKAIIPAHQLKTFTKGVFDYETKFLDRYGKCFMTELIHRHCMLRSKNMKIKICDRIKEWTLRSVGPKTILSFLRQCTQRDNRKDTDVGVLPISSFTEESDDDIEPTVEELFVVYTNWRRKGVRLSRTDPTNLIDFRTHLEFYHPISYRQRVIEEDEYKHVDDEPEEYIANLFLTREAQLLSFSSGSNILGSIIDSSSTTRKLLGSSVVHISSD